MLNVTFTYLPRAFRKVLAFVLFSLAFAQVAPAALACADEAIAIQDLEKIAKSQRRLLKKLAEDLAKDGLLEACQESLQVFETLAPSSKEMADLRAKTQKSLFKSKDNPKTKRLAKHMASCEQIALKLADTAAANPEAGEALSKAALALDHSCVVVHQSLGHIKGSDGVWRTENSAGMLGTWQSWNAACLKIARHKLEIKEVMAPNWARRSVGQEAKGFEVLGVHVCGLQKPSLLKERLQSLVRVLQFVNFLKGNDYEKTGRELFHLCAGSSEKVYELALKNLQEQKLVTFGDLNYELQWKNGCFFGFGVDRLDKEKEWLFPVATSVLAEDWSAGLPPNWFAAGLANYAALMAGSVPIELVENTEWKADPELSLKRPLALIHEVDKPVIEMMKNRQLSNFDRISFVPIEELSPNEIALSTSLVEFILLRKDGMQFPLKFNAAAQEILNGQTPQQMMDWVPIMDKALGQPIKEFEAEWREWLAAGQSQSLKTTLANLE
ncbi:MAG: hypothetical protein HQ519_14545 [Planctomycetes bacterium]|nr:hypothetical protein [Planctomycetota bacterium]